MRNIAEPMRKEVPKVCFMSLFLLTPDLEKMSYLAERLSKSVLVTFEDQKAKPVPKNWRIYFLKNTLHNATLDLLLDKNFRKIARREKIKHIYVFKSSYLIEKEVKKLDLKILNPSAVLAEKIEGKVSQVDFFGELKKYFPKFVLTKVGAMSYEKLVNSLDTKLMVQFNLSHSGSGTFLLTKKLWNKWAQQFPNRPVRVSRFVSGQTLTVNLIVLPKKIVLGQPSLQLTGLKELTDQKFSTVGNAWLKFKPSLEKDILNLSQKVGRVLQKENFYGPIGLDFIYGSYGKKLYLIEINARQPASSSLESWLCHLNGRPALFDYLINFWHDGESIHAKVPNKKGITGGQVVLRATQKWQGIIKKIPATGIYTIEKGQVKFKKKQIFWGDKEEFLVHTMPTGRKIAAGQEVLKVQTGRNFVNFDLHFSREMNGLVKFFKKTIKFS